MNAVIAAVETSGGNGHTEGQINRLKAIKRQNVRMPRVPPFRVRESYVIMVREAAPKVWKIHFSHHADSPLQSLQPGGYNLLHFSTDWMPRDMPTICQDRSRLLRVYVEAASGYSARVRELADFVISQEEVRVNEARRICLTAWHALEKSRLAFHRHEVEHGCDREAEIRNVSDI